MDASLESTDLEKDQLCEFYLHNLFVSRSFERTHNPYIGDFQLRALCSWMNHEIKRVDFEMRALYS